MVRRIQQVAYARDPLGRLVGVSENGQSIANYAYDGADNLVQITYANGLRKEIQYNSRSFPVRELYYRGAL